MQNEELLNMILPGYCPIAKAPTYEQLMQKERGPDEYAPDDEIARAALRREWDREYKTMNLKGEAWLVQNPACMSLQFIANGSQKPIRRRPPRMMLTASQVQKEARSATSDNERCEALPGSNKKQLSWDGWI